MVVAADPPLTADGLEQIGLVVAVGIDEPGQFTALHDIQRPVTPSCAQRLVQTEGEPLELCVKWRNVVRPFDDPHFAASCGDDGPAVRHNVHPPHFQHHVLRLDDAQQAIVLRLRRGREIQIQTILQQRCNTMIGHGLHLEVPAADTLGDFGKDGVAPFLNIQRNQVILEIHSAIGIDVDHQLVVDPQLQPIVAADVALDARVTFRLEFTEEVCRAFVVAGLIIELLEIDRIPPTEASRSPLHGLTVLPRVLGRKINTQLRRIDDAVAHPIGIVKRPDDVPRFPVQRRGILGHRGGARFLPRRLLDVVEVGRLPPHLTADCYSHSDRE